MHPPFALHRAILRAIIHSDEFKPHNIPHITDEGDIYIMWRGYEYILRAIPKGQITYRAFLYREP